MFDTVTWINVMNVGYFVYTAAAGVSS